MNCLSRRAERVVPTTPPLPSPAKLPIPPASPAVVAHAGLLDVVVGEVVGEAVGIVGIVELGKGPTKGNTLGSGTAGVELTPRLPISKDPIGSPVRAPPPGVVGDVDVGLDDAATLLEPDPHMPDIPEVSSTAEDPVVTGISDVTGVAGDVDVPDIAVVPDVAALPEFTAVAGEVVPTAIPPPSKLAAEPNICEGEVAAVEHAVPLPVAGVVIVPVTPVGAGLTPSDVNSVEPSGTPVAPTDPAAPIPSGEVAPSEGIVAIGSVSASSTWANAGLPYHKGSATAAIKNDLIRTPRVEPVDYAARRSGGAMNSGPTGSLTVSCRIRSISAIAALSMRQPTTSAIGAS